MYKNNQEWISIALEEYKSLRAESLASIQSQQSSLRFGLIALVGLLSLSVKLLLDNNLLSLPLFLFFIPIASYISLTIWLGEVTRMMRVGQYLMVLENKINKKVKGNPLFWENWLRSGLINNKKPQLLINYISIISLFFLFAIGSILIGNYVLYHHKDIGNMSYENLFLLVNSIEFFIFSIFFSYVFLIGVEYK